MATAGNNVPLVRIGPKHNVKLNLTLTFMITVVELDHSPVCSPDPADHTLPYHRNIRHSRIFIFIAREIIVWCPNPYSVFL
jgi:hypothetical protein